MYQGGRRSSRICTKMKIRFFAFLANEGCSRLGELMQTSTPKKEFEGHSSCGNLSSLGYTIPWDLVVEESSLLGKGREDFFRVSLSQAREREGWIILVGMSFQLHTGVKRPCVLHVKYGGLLGGVVLYRGEHVWTNSPRERS